MIEVMYDREAHRLAVTGHAYSNERGKDLVCAAASMLVGTLAVNVLRLADCMPEHFKLKAFRMNSGDAEFWLAADEFTTPMLVFDTVALGFELLSDKYPAYVKIL